MARAGRLGSRDRNSVGVKRAKGRAKISARSGRAIQIMRVRAGFEPSVARVIVEDYTVSRPIDQFLFRGLYYQAQDLVT
jgi:hypothetical protein